MVNPSVVKLTLPSSKKAMEMNKQQITIYVTADKKYYLNDSKEATKPQVLTAEQLEDALRPKIAGLTDPTAVLRLDKALTVQDLVDVLQIGSDLKMKMILATQPAK